MNDKKYQYTRNVEVELELHGDDIAIKFCDANVAQWAEPMGPLSDWDDDDQLVDEITSAIESNARDLAETIVNDLRSRVLAVVPGE